MCEVRIPEGTKEAFQMATVDAAGRFARPALATHSYPVEWKAGGTVCLADLVTEKTFKKEFLRDLPGFRHLFMSKQ